MASQPYNPIEIFYSYAHEDEELRDELKKHLANLKRQKAITDWYDRDIAAGEEWDDEIKKHLNSAKVILLLISPDFMNSDYSNDVEVKRAMERHESGEARVIPIILRPVDWEGAPFSKLQGLPPGAKAISLWSNYDEAFVSVVKEIRKALKQLSIESPNANSPAKIPRPPVVGFVSRRDRQGRDIVERLKEELAPHKNQLVALWGPGGSGKTTLAAEATRALADVFKHRIAWVSPLLRADLTFLTLLDEIASQLGGSDLRTLVADAKEKQVSTLIASAPTLIVLDNFETITPEEEQIKCVTFLANSASCPVLITTRTNIDEAFNIPLAAMSVGEAREFLARLGEQTRTPAKFDKIDRDHLIQKCEANPLVLQWVVRQIDLAMALPAVMSYLSKGGGNAAERVFTRSFELPQLGEDGRAVLLALSLFVPSATRDALAQVAGFDADVDRLDQAVARLSSLWLLETAEDDERLMIQGLTRELAKARLSHDKHDDEYRRRFVVYFTRYAAAHAKPAPEDYDALEAEKDNVLSAMDVAFDLSDWKSVQQMATILVDPVEGVLALHGNWDEALRRGTQALEAARKANNKSAIPKFAGNMGAILHLRGEYNQARLAYEQAVVAFRTLGNDRNVAVGLHRLAVVAHHQGKIIEARRLYDESLEISERLGDEGGIANCLHQLAWLAHSQGEINEAHQLYEQSLEIYKRLGNQGHIANGLHQLAMLAQGQGDLDEAQRLYNESLEIHERLGDRRGIALGLGQLATLARDRGELDEARRLYHESLEISKRLGAEGGIANTLHQLAMLAQDQGKLAEARQLYNESLATNMRLGNQRGIAYSLHQLATLAQDQKEFDEARRLYNQSLEIKQSLGDQHGIALTLGQLGRLAESEGSNAKAAKLFNEAFAIFEKLKSPIAEIARRDLERVKGNSS